MAFRRKSSALALASIPLSEEDARTSQDTVFEYSQKLSQHVVALEAENIKLQDANDALNSEIRVLKTRVDNLERENGSLRDAGLATFQERHIAVQSAKESLDAKQGELSLARHAAEQNRQRAEALAVENDRLRGISERLQTEVSQMQRQLLGLEVTANSMEAQLVHQAAQEAESANVRGSLERHLDALTLQKQRLDEQAGVLFCETAQMKMVRDEHSAERAHSQHLEQLLQASNAEAARLREDVTRMTGVANSLQLEVAQQRDVVFSMQQPRFSDEAARHQSAIAESLRGFIKNLEQEITSLRRTTTALEAENGSLRDALGVARADAHRALGASTRLAAEKSQSEKLADDQIVWRHEAERRITDLASEATRLRSQSEQLRQDRDGHKERAARAEAENMMLRGKLTGADVLIRGLREECQKHRNSAAVTVGSPALAHGLPVQISR